MSASTSTFNRAHTQNTELDKSQLSASRSRPQCYTAQSQSNSSVGANAIAPPKAAANVNVVLGSILSVNVNSSDSNATVSSKVANANSISNCNATTAGSSSSRRMSLFSKASPMSEYRPPSSSSRKGKEVMEMTAVPLHVQGSASRSGSPLQVTVPAAGGGVSKEEMAMAKWRKWVVEQPIETGDSTSPVRSRASSPASNVPGHQRDASSSTHPSNLSPTARSPFRTSSGDTALLSSPLAMTFQSPTQDMYNTESVRALRDVELAVDEEILERVERTREIPRRLSTQPRISELPNPFVDISSRLGSRRVRPITLELIQALGHFIDAVWCTNYPHRPCPWIIGVDESPAAPSIRRMNYLHHLEVTAWKSQMITAVQEGKDAGYVASPPTAKDVGFWLDEVTFAIRDVDEVVGIYKGVGWAFSTALRMGIYGEVSTDNVLGTKGEGGGMARLLNDLEEAIWGDAAPRPTDLSYALPLDFDPYAVLDDAELMAAASSACGPRGRALSDFFGGHQTTTPEICTPMDDGDMYNLPDLVDASNSDGQHTDGGIASPVPSALEGERQRRFGSLTISTDGIPGAEEMSLEELGKRRHQEWLDSQRANGVRV